MSSPSDSPTHFAQWMSALEARHLADLRMQEVTRALRSLSAGYVDGRRDIVQRSLDTRGKRAAFALYYAPLHFLAIDFIIRALNAQVAAPDSILDIGCGTGAAGAAWALAAGGAPGINGIDRHPWAVEEARWTYRTLGVRGRARRSDRIRIHTGDTGIVAAYVLNELPEPARHSLEDSLVDAAARGSRILVVEPVSRRVTPWWDATASRLAGASARADEWRFRVELPPILRLLDKAAGLDHRELTARSIYCAGQPEA